MTYLISMLVVVANPGDESVHVSARELASQVQAEYGNLEAVAFVRESTITFPTERFPDVGTERIVIQSVMTKSGQVCSEARQLIDGKLSGARIIFRSDGKQYESVRFGDVPQGGCRGLGWQPEPGYSQCMLGGMFTSRIWKDGRSFHDYVDDLTSGAITGTATVDVSEKESKQCYVVEVKRMNGDGSVAGVLLYYVGVEDHHLWRYHVERFGSGVKSDDYYRAWIENPTIVQKLFEMGSPLTPSGVIPKLESAPLALVQHGKPGR